MGAVLEKIQTNGVESVIDEDEVLEILIESKRKQVQSEKKSDIKPSARDET